MITGHGRSAQRVRPCRVGPAAGLVGLAVVLAGCAQAQQVRALASAARTPSAAATASASLSPSPSPTHPPLPTPSAPGILRCDSAQLRGAVTDLEGPSHGGEPPSSPGGGAFVFWDAGSQPCALAGMPAVVFLRNGQELGAIAGGPGPPVVGLPLGTPRWTGGLGGQGRWGRGRIIVRFDMGCAAVAGDPPSVSPDAFLVSFPGASALVGFGYIPMPPPPFHPYYPPFCLGTFHVTALLPWN